MCIKDEDLAELEELEEPEDELYYPEYDPDAWREWSWH